MFLECPLLDNSHTSTSPTDPSPSVATESLPSTYATLPRTTKLDEEPNPFEQSFSSGIDKEDNRTLGNSNSNSNRRILPPLAAIDSPTRGVISRKDEIIWDSLRSGPLSPSMLTGPAEDKRSRDHHHSCKLRRRSTTEDKARSDLYYLKAYHQRSGSMMKYEVIPSTSSAIVDRAQMVSSTSMYNYPASTAPASAIVAPSSAQAPGRETTGQVAPSSNDEFPPPPPPPSSSFVKRKYPTSAHVTPPPPPSSTTTAEIIHEHPSIKRRAQTKYVDDEEKRKNFLERNRQGMDWIGLDWHTQKTYWDLLLLAAFKCRQRKKQWVQDLQSNAEYLTATNEQLKMESARLREEIFHLKSLLQEHTSCPLNPQAVLEAINRPIPHSDTITQYPPTSTEPSPSTAIQRI